MSKSCEKLTGSPTTLGKRACVPEGNTPGKSKTKRGKQGKRKGPKKSLFTDETSVKNQKCDPNSIAYSNWTTSEITALVQHICLFWDGAHLDKWPTLKNMQFWNECASSVNQICNNSRTGSSCRTIVTKHLNKQFKTLSEAEDFYDIDYISEFTYSKENNGTSTPSKQFIEEISACLSPIFSSSPMKESKLSLGDTIKKFVTAFTTVMSDRLQKQILQYIYRHVIVSSGGNAFYSFVEHDFLWKSLSAMKVLHIEGKHNLLYHLSRCFSFEEENGPTRMPLTRMPYGLIDYNIRFFSSESSQKLGLEEHYAVWLETMLAHFGQKWLCLFRGPCWQYELNDDSQETPHIEIPCVSNGVPSSSNEEILECWNDKIPASWENAMQPSSSNGIPLSSDAEIQLSSIAESSSRLSDEIPPTLIGQNPPSSDDEIHASWSNEIPASSNDEILHRLNAEIPPTSNGQKPPSPNDELQYIVNGKLASIIANALKDCSLDLMNYSNDDQKCISEIDDTDFQLENLCCLVDNGDHRNSEGAHAVENGNHPAGSFNSRIKRSHLWTHVTDEDKQAIENGQISTECMEHHHNIVPTSKVRKSTNPYMYDTTKAKVNVASIGIRQLQKRVAASGFIKSSQIQNAKTSKPNGRWWVKADACDIREGLRESVNGLWSGDEDLGNGAVAKLYSEYSSKCSSLKNLCARRKCLSVEVINKLSDDLVQDIEFIEKGMSSAKRTYEEKLEKSRVSDNLMMKLAWDVAGYEQLLVKAKEFKKDFDLMADELKLGIGEVVVHLQKLEKNLLMYNKELYSKKRNPASHLLVFMIADELRNTKPYAIPIQFIPIKSITDQQIRLLELEIETAMKSIGMVPVGFTTDGEFNSLRTMGNKRPVSILELIRNAKVMARQLGGKTVTKYFTLNKNGTGTVENHPAVPLDDIIWLHDYMNEDKDHSLPFENYLRSLRRKLFPFSHDPYPFVTGRSETKAEILMSIMAIYLFRWEVNRLKELPDDLADFSLHLYQPERDNETHEYLHHREDHNHVLKRLINCLREGSIPGIDIRFFREALHDPNTGLTYESVTGKNKQSVPDCERLISPAVVSFLRKKGDETGANILSIISNWHKAVDGRGLNEETRSAYLADMKNWLLDDWMPWHTYVNDYSTIDVNRPIKGICGLTRELVVALVANIESRELRRREYERRQMKPEHPRASSSDDVEGFFSLLHGMLGPVFDLTQFYDDSRKILNEFSKRINPVLPFFYWSGKNERFRDFELPSFNQASKPGAVERLDRVKISRRGDPGVFVANRASLPQKGQLTCRAMFHKTPIALPPLDSQ